MKHGLNEKVRKCAPCAAAKRKMTSHRADEPIKHLNGRAMCKREMKIDFARHRGASECSESLRLVQTRNEK